MLSVQTKIQISLIFQMIQSPPAHQKSYKSISSDEQKDEKEIQQDQSIDDDLQIFVVESNQSQIKINNRLNMILGVLILIVISVIATHKILFDNELKNDASILKSASFGNLNQQIQAHHYENSGDTGLDINKINQANINDESKPESLTQTERIRTEEFHGQEQQESDSSKKPNNQDSIKKPSNTKPPKNSFASRYNLNDFIAEKPYKQAPEDIRNIFDEMIKRDSDRHAKPNKIFYPSQKAYFAYNLYRYPDNLDYQRAEYFYYDNKYNISRYGGPQQQLPLCIVAPGRNIVSDDKYEKFIDSIFRQNYTNYKLIYIDDVSTDESAQKLRAYVENKHPKFNDKLTIVENTQRIYALANKNKGIRKYCSEDDIVLDIDSDDSLVGHLPFQFVNAIYHDDSVWQANSVFIYISEEKKQVTTGTIDGIPDQILKQNQYRGSMVWKSEELRTYRAKLFMKIDENDFKDEKGEFYQWASDHFIQEPLTQLSGYEHYRHFYEIMYFYNWKINRKTIYMRRHYRDIAWMQTPYKPLKSLNDRAEKVQNYAPPEKMRKQYEKNIRNAKKQAIKFGREIPF